MRGLVRSALLGILIGALLGFPIAAWGQAAGPLYQRAPTLLLNAVQVNGSSVTFDVSLFQAVAFQASGTFVGLIVFEGTVDGTNYPSDFVHGAGSLTCYRAGNTTGSSSAREPGIYRCNVAGYRSVRATEQYYVSGSIGNLNP